MGQRGDAPMALQASRKRSDPFRRYAREMDTDYVAWTGPRGQVFKVRADAARNYFAKTPTGLTRQGAKYRGKKNSEGYYFFAQTNQMVWFESLNEQVALMVMDLELSVDRVQAQPFALLFREGGYAYPDFFIMLSDGRQLVIDVKDERDAELFEAKRKLTQRACASAGWEYRVFYSVSAQLQYNVTWISYFRRTAYAADPDLIQVLGELLVEPTSLWRVLQDLRRTDRNGLGPVFHLIWEGRLLIDFNQQLSYHSKVAKGPLWNAKSGWEKASA
jgi:hypothetical protein